ncbi:MAG: PLD nuclease N-terminal domain-containing protein [Yaniella sp.]|uniref:PLD nuclease N-terminal domain-containing protein n=1 Tax=Yaniella sp. TaxID=2773929 RepID=UPI002648F27D|nr:PLD nuclease N-terminal domain-containing protein [Yaniella sp.]MDN5704696.1 PLD nuclease N-terminal domain-containing protein [Yaniella sp.]MDN5731308.1 PLD nuclease N-terminal domain-containing protein [Yaniella sp.]MDN5814448.1 PLD nuclease N-terminal domain-containing protein [Yaniella sp.]MDN5818249.1 PLD nuclease N-terminal domain-containing protein [Yaniella sp.]MDN5837816.1 PLD nuclease N-terminal domain-containing protein [Yaniella sp.]
MPRLLIPLIIVSVGVMIYALIEAISTPSARTRIMPKGIWIVVIILVPLIGGVLWLLFGNENSYLASTVQGFQKTSGPTRPTTPDDDEEFLRSLDVQRNQKRRDEELDRRERELRRREEDLEDDSDEDQNPA